MSFLQNPNLPRGGVSLCAVSARYPAIIAALERLGIRCVAIEPYPGLSAPVASHADMQLCDLGQGRVAVAADSPAAGELAALGFTVHAAEPPTPRYPGDVRLNAALVGKVCFCRQDVIDKNITNYCTEQGIAIANVRQGYAKCSVCVVNDHAIITADPSIARAARAHAFDLLQISPGAVQLDGCDTGFIGGTCGLLAQDLLAFTGTLQSHPDGDAIRAFAQAHGVHVLELTDAPLLDVGSILPLAEIIAPAKT